MLLELSEGSDPVFQLPFPVVPKLRRHAGPIAGRVRDKGFSIRFLCRESNHFGLRTKTVRPEKTVSMQALKSAPRTCYFARFLSNYFRAVLPFTSDNRLTPSWSKIVRFPSGAIYTAVPPRNTNASG